MPPAVRASPKTGQGDPDGMEDLAALLPLIRQLVARAFERITVRRGTLNITMADGSVVTLKEIEAEVSRRKGQIETKGSFTVRGQRVAFVATLGQPVDKKGTLRRPLQATFKGSLIQGSFDGQLDLAPDLQLTGAAEMSTPSLRRIGRWFGIPLQSTDGFNAATIKAELTWARRVLAFEKALLTIDGSEANGRGGAEPRRRAPAHRRHPRFQPARSHAACSRPRGCSCSASICPVPRGRRSTSRCR